MKKTVFTLLFYKGYEVEAVTRAANNAEIPNKIVKVFPVHGLTEIEFEVEALHEIFLLGQFYTGWLEIYRKDYKNESGPDQVQAAK